MTSDHLQIKDNISKILQRARIVVGEIQELDGDLSISDRNSYDFVRSRLDDLLGFDEFSLAEYTYVLAHGKRPGLRVQLRRIEEGHLISWIVFEDVVQWRVDFEGHKLSTEVLRLILSGPSIEAVVPEHPSLELPRAGSTWSELVAAAIQAPLSLFGERAAGSSDMVSR